MYDSGPFSRLLWFDGQFRRRTAVVDDASYAAGLSTRVGGSIVVVIVIVFVRFLIITSAASVVAVVVFTAIGLVFAVVFGVVTRILVLVPIVRVTRLRILVTVFRNRLWAVDRASRVDLGGRSNGRDVCLFTTRDVELREFAGTERL